MVDSKDIRRSEILIVCTYRKCMLPPLCSGVFLEIQDGSQYGCPNSKMYNNWFYAIENVLLHMFVVKMLSSNTSKSVEVIK